jgi:hypothetical protein
MSLLEDIILLRIEVAKQVAGMKATHESETFKYCLIEDVCKATSNLVATLKALGGNLPVAVQGLLPQLKASLKEYVAQSHDMRGYFGGVVDLPYKEEKLIKYIYSYADDLEVISRIKLTEVNLGNLLDDLAKERLRTKALKDKNKELKEKNKSLNKLIEVYEGRLNEHNRCGVICLAVDEMSPLDSTDIHEALKVHCKIRDIDYNLCTFDPPKYNQFSNRLEISYRY